MSRRPAPRPVLRAVVSQAVTSAVNRSSQAQPAMSRKPAWAAEAQMAGLAPALAKDPALLKTVTALAKRSGIDFDNKADASKLVGFAKKVENVLGAVATYVAGQMVASATSNIARNQQNQQNMQNMPTPNNMPAVNNDLNNIINNAMKDGPVEAAVVGLGDSVPDADMDPTLTPGQDPTLFENQDPTLMENQDPTLNTMNNGPSFSMSNDDDEKDTKKMGEVLKEVLEHSGEEGSMIEAVEKLFESHTKVEIPTLTRD